MKNLKLGKASQLMLSAGVFIIILSGLGITYSKQMQEKGQLDEQLYMSRARLEKLTVSELEEQLAVLRAKVNAGGPQISGARETMNQNIDSVEVTDLFFAIAEESNVTVNGLSTSVIMERPVGAINCSTITLSATVTGEVPDLVQFVINLNEGYVSGYAGSAQIIMSRAGDNNEPTANIQMTAFSCGGS
jgi:hypothetical protein